MDLLPALALLASIFACFLSAMSYILQKKAHLATEKTDEPAWKSCNWISGLILVIVAGVINVGAAPFADLVFLS